MKSGAVEIALEREVRKWGADSKNWSSYFPVFEGNLFVKTWCRSQWPPLKRSCSGFEKAIFRGPFFLLDGLYRADP